MPERWITQQAIAHIWGLTHERVNLDPELTGITLPVSHRMNAIITPVKSLHETRSVQLPDPGLPVNCLSPSLCRPGRIGAEYARKKHVTSESWNYKIPKL
jgi:hypothetical protein